MAFLTGFLVAQSFFGTLPIDGIRCDREEGAVEHIHINLQLYDRGRSVPVPAGVGIPQGSDCLYWLHTHSADGFIHIESPVKRTFVLGEFFDVWGPDLSWTHAATLAAPHGHRLVVWVNGNEWHGDPRAIVLRDHETIVIQNAPPFAKPAHPDWSKL
ncbi:MAG: hypothetical protein JOZ77_02615 [Candidatus Eremiobacteraeota bacterium]|nr:hypothetical protein [Candidatus Eremiobacteraeota bacterium]